MPDEELLKSWAKTERHLKAAQGLLPKTAETEALHREFTEYLEHNELELAMEALAGVPASDAHPDFWRSLRDAAGNMGLEQRRLELHQSFLIADEEFRRTHLSPRDLEAFDPDGSLRDIYIKGTDVQAWQQLIDHLTATYPTEFVEHPEGITTPPPAAEIFSKRDEMAMTLRIDVRGLRINTHFFIEEEIELDVDPSEVRSQQDVDSVLQFMIEIGDLLNREVVLTPENIDDVPIYRYRPGTGSPEYVPPPFG